MDDNSDPLVTLSLQVSLEDAHILAGTDVPPELTSKLLSALVNLARESVSVRSGSFPNEPPTAGQPSEGEAIGFASSVSDADEVSTALPGVPGVGVTEGEDRNTFSHEHLMTDDSVQMRTPADHADRRRNPPRIHEIPRHAGPASPSNRVPALSAGEEIRDLHTVPGPGRQVQRDNEPNPAPPAHAPVAVNPVQGCSTRNSERMRFSHRQGDNGLDPHDRYTARDTPAPPSKQVLARLTVFLRTLSNKLPTATDTPAMDVAFESLLDTILKMRDDGAPPASQSNSINSVLQRVASGNRKSAGVNFECMMDKLHLAAITDSLLGGARFPTTDDLYTSLNAGSEPIIGVAVGTFRGWIRDGHKYANIAGGGTLFFLLSIAHFNMLNMVTRASEDDMRELGNVLRHQSMDPTCSRIISERIVPWLELCARRVHLTIKNMFPPEYPGHHLLASILDAQDLVASDAYFSAYKQNHFRLISRRLGWWDVSCRDHSGRAIAMTEVHVSSAGVQVTSNEARPSKKRRAVSTQQGNTTTQTLPKPEKGAPNSIIRIATGCKIDTTNHCPHDPIERAQWTEVERERAAQAEQPSDLKSLRTMLRKQFDKSGCKKDGCYTKLDQPFISGKETRIECADGSLLAFLVGTLPRDIRDNVQSDMEALLAAHKVCEEHKLRVKLGDETPSSFSTLHFCYWCRNAIRGDGAPADVHARYLECTDATQTNYSQMLPYPSSDIVNHRELYDDLRSVFRPLFSWMHDKLKELLPDEFRALEVVAELLPGHAPAPAHPFTGVILNINVCTLAHKDPKDLKLCVVIPVGEFTGGELCFAEAGLVFSLHNGDMVVFPSNKLTHFNLNYEGARASFVFSTDFAFERYSKDYNGWVHNESLSI